MNMDILDKAKNTIKKYNMLDLNDKVLMGISGGPDSVMLFRILNDLKDDYKLKLKVAHLDHMIRKEDSYQDMEFVKSLCKNFNIDFCFKRVDIEKIAREKKDSVEKVARAVRYDFFAQVAEKEGFKKIALGHNADDQVETILMRIIRGTGLSGLTGIPFTRRVSKKSNILIIRPLIEINADEIRQDLQDKNIQYRQDYTNEEEIYFRNKIRHQFLPLLKKYNANINQLILNMSDSISVIENYITKEGKRRFKSASNKKDDNILLDLRRFNRYHEAIQREVFRNCIKELKKDLKKITYQHWNEFSLLVNERPTGSIVDFPFNIAAKKIKRKIIFYKKS